MALGRGNHRGHKEDQAWQWNTPHTVRAPLSCDRIHQTPYLQILMFFVSLLMRRKIVAITFLQNKMNSNLDFQILASYTTGFSVETHLSLQYQLVPLWEWGWEREAGSPVPPKSWGIVGLWVWALLAAFLSLVTWPWHLSCWERSPAWPQNWQMFWSVPQ